MVSKFLIAGRRSLMDEHILEAIKVLHEGGVVAHPTETCYGLAADIFQKKALDRLYSLKKMPFQKPVSILVRDLEEAQQYGEFSSLALKLALQYWPGPLTIVVPRTALVPKFLNFSYPTIGLRVSSNKKARQLLEAFGGALTTTSANLFTLPEAYTAPAFLDQGLAPDFILDGGQIPKTPPSTIVEVKGDQVTVLRQGSVELLD